jgi:hypothetical protein
MSLRWSHTLDDQLSPPNRRHLGNLSPKGDAFAATHEHVIVHCSLRFRLPPVIGICSCDVSVYTGKGKKYGGKADCDDI